MIRGGYASGDGPSSKQHSAGSVSGPEHRPNSEARLKRPMASLPTLQAARTYLGQRTIDGSTRVTVDGLTSTQISQALPGSLRA